MLQAVLLWVALSILAIGFMLSLQAGQEAARYRDRGRKVAFYLMAALVGLAGVGITWVYVLFAIAPG